MLFCFFFFINIKFNWFNGFLIILYKCSNKNVCLDVFTFEMQFFFFCRQCIVGHQCPITINYFFLFLLNLFYVIFINLCMFFFFSIFLPSFELYMYMNVVSVQVCKCITKRKYLQKIGGKLYRCHCVVVGITCGSLSVK